MRLTIAQILYRKRLAHGSVIEGARLLAERIAAAQAGQRKHAA